MGNAATKEARGHGHSDSGNGRSSARHTHPSHNTSRYRGGRNDGSFWGLGIGYDGERPNVMYKETRQEREARRAERERAARVAERERSTKEENVDGGFLVALGIYVGAEDWNKSIVRRLIIERKLAPYWKGLAEFDEKWTEHQIMAAVRDLPIPPPDQVPPELDYNALQKNPFPNGAHSTKTDGARAHNKTNSDNLTFSSILAQSSSSPSPYPDPLRLHSKSAVPRDSEISLPRDPFVNGQPLEVYLYKSGMECPICFLYYPTYVNTTNCCHQPICSECFVKIKRPDPHHAEHRPHDSDDNSAAGQERSVGNGNTGNNDEIVLVSEPASCPYCTIPNFGVVYTPPPFRRGLAYASDPFTQKPDSLPGLSHHQPSDLPSAQQQDAATPPAPTVVTTDMIRPDWSQKLQHAREHAARRAAAATAIHTAAYLMNDGSGRSREGRSGVSGDAAGSSNNERPFSSLISRRMLRAATGHAHSPRHDQHQDGGTPSSAGRPRNRSSGSGNGDERQLSEDSGSPSSGPLRRSRAHHSELVSALAASGVVPASVSSGRQGQERAEELEEMMLREAVRQSLASEEERKKKEEEAVKKQEAQEEEGKKSAQFQTAGETETEAGPSRSSASTPALAEVAASSAPGEQSTQSPESSLNPRAVFLDAEETGSPPSK